MLVLGGRLEPENRVLFSGMFHGVSRWNLHQGRNQWKRVKAKRGLYWSLLTNFLGVLIMIGAFREAGKIPVYRGFQAGHYLFAGWGQSPGCERDGTSQTRYFLIFQRPS